MSEFRHEVKQGFDATNTRITDFKTDVDKKLDGINPEFTDFKTDVNKTLDGIGVYLQSINRSIEEHAQEIFILKKRVDKFDPPEDTARTQT